MSDFFLGTGRLPPSLRSETDSAPAEESYSQSSRHVSYDREDATDRHSRDDVRDGDWRSERFREISQGRDSRERRRRSRSRSPQRRHRDDSDKWEPKRSDRYDDPPQRSRGYRDLDEQPYDHADRRGDARGSEPRRLRETTDVRGERERGRGGDDIPPSSTLVLRALSLATTEEGIGAALAHLGPLIDIRVARDRDTNQSRGLAFVDFPSVEAAMAAMAALRGRLLLDSQDARVEYSRDAKAAVPGARPAAPKVMDWVCGRCSTVNFARRNQCFSCAAPRAEDAVLVSATIAPAPRAWEAGGGAGAEEPCHILIVRGLPPGATEESIRATFAHFAPVGLVRIIHEHGTGQSRGFCFVDFASVTEAARVLREAQGVVIDGQPVRLAYARPKDAVAGSSDRDRGGAGRGGATGLGSLALEQARAIASGQVYATPPNVPEGFVHDPRSGWYYHAATGYYFDASTSLYYPPATQKYYRYDHAGQQYVEYDGAGIALFNQGTADWTEPADAAQTPSQAAEAAAAAAAAAAAQLAEFKKKKKKSAAGAGGAVGGITGMRINVSSDLNKWKTQQQVGPNSAVATPDAPPPSSAPRIAAAAGQLAPPPPPASGWSDPAAAAGGWDDSEGPNPPPAPTAFVALPAAAPAAPAASPAPTAAAPAAGGEGAVCYLCRRKFATLEQLQKHEQLSELHRQKVEEAKRQEIKQIKAEVLTEAKALERREERLQKKAQYAERARDEREHLQTLHTAAKAAMLGGGSAGASAAAMQDNKGTDLMRRMGWREGEGLGRGGDGLRAPVQVVLRSERAGLGSGEGLDVPMEHMVTPGDSLSTAARKKAAARYERDPTDWRPAGSGND